MYLVYPGIYILHIIGVLVIICVILFGVVAEPTAPTAPIAVRIAPAAVPDEFNTSRNWGTRYSPSRTAGTWPFRRCKNGSKLNSFQAAVPHDDVGAVLMGFNKSPRYSTGCSAALPTADVWPVSPPESRSLFALVAGAFRLYTSLKEQMFIQKGTHNVLSQVPPIC